MIAVYTLSALFFFYAAGGRRLFLVIGLHCYQNGYGYCQGEEYVFRDNLPLVMRDRR